MQGRTSRGPITGRLRPPAREAVALGLAVLLILVEIAWLLLYRRVNQDEGWYLWAAKLVYERKLLYRDFAYPQTPLLPYVYGAFTRVFGQGLYQGRLITALFAVATMALGAAIARRRAGSPAALFFLLLQASSLYAAAYHFAYTAPYALCAFLIMLGVYVAFYPPRRIDRAWPALACLVLAVGVRLSVAAAVVPFALYLVVTAAGLRRSLLRVVGAGLAAGAVVFAPFLATSGSVMFYDIFGFHTDRMPLNWQISSMRYSLLTTLQDFAVPLALAALGLLAWLVALALAGDRRAALRHRLPELAMGTMSLALFAAHLVPRTTGSFYNALQMPLLDVLIAILLARGWQALAGRSRLRMAAGAALAGILLLNGVLQAQALVRRELIGVPPQNQIAVVRSAAQFLARNLPPGSRLLTFNTHLALESGMDIPPGFEMSVFSYQPTWTTEKARRYHFVNNELLLDALAEPAAAVAPAGVALSDFDMSFLYGDRDRLLDTLQANYRWVKTVPGFGPLDDSLRIYLLPRFIPPAPQVALSAQLDGGISFLGYDAGPRAYHAGDTLDVALYWQAATPPGRSYTVFTHLLDASGALAAGWDNPPCHRTCPTDSWRAGEVIRDEYDLALDKNLPPGQYTLEAGMYDSSTGARLPVQIAGQPPADRILLGAIAVTAH